MPTRLIRIFRSYCSQVIRLFFQHNRRGNCTAHIELVGKMGVGAQRLYNESNPADLDSHVLVKYVALSSRRSRSSDTMQPNELEDGYFEVENCYTTFLKLIMYILEIEFGFIE